MNGINWREHITVDPDVYHGQACIKGTRVMASVVLDNLAANVSREDILRSYPSLTPEAVRATIAYAAELSRERVVSLTAQSQHMRFKIDENLPDEVAESPRRAGHDVTTVCGEMSGEPDPDIAPT